MSMVAGQIKWHVPLTELYVFHAKSNAGVLYFVPIVTAGSNIQYGLYISHVNSNGLYPMLILHTYVHPTSILMAGLCVPHAVQWQGFMYVGSLAKQSYLCNVDVF
jgi:hypothetical protein